MLLPLISKIMEKLIHEQTSSFLSNNEISYNYQPRFWKNHSTGSCLTFLHDKILKGFDKSLMTGTMLIDLQKAFDTIDHDILLKRLSAIGFSNHTIGWFKSYLSNRLFRVNLGNCYSDPSNITGGVPQGSILGPLLFLTLFLTWYRLLNQICFYMLMTLALFFSERILYKLKNHQTEILKTSVNGL